MGIDLPAAEAPLRGVIGRRFVAAAALLAAVAFVSEGRAQTLGDCGPLANAYGPYDYANPADRRDRLPIVEQHHFTPDIYALRRGESGSVLVELEYTLRAFPNHHLALEAMARLHRNYDAEKFDDGLYSISCWFDRAMRFRPEDGMVPLIYGIHLFYLGKLGQAEEQLVRAAELMPDSAEVHYNLGLLYVRQGKHARAKEHAVRAYDLGFPLPGLRDQLARAGHWND